MASESVNATRRRVEWSCGCDFGDGTPDLGEGNAKNNNKKQQQRVETEMSFSAGGYYLRN